MVSEWQVTHAHESDVFGHAMASPLQFLQCRNGQPVVERKDRVGRLTRRSKKLIQGGLNNGFRDVRRRRAGYPMGWELETLSGHGGLEAGKAMTCRLARQINPEKRDARSTEVTEVRDRLSDSNARVPRHGADFADKSTQFIGE